MTDLIDKIKQIGNKKGKIIGIGISDNLESNLRILQAINNINLGPHQKIVLVGNEKNFTSIRDEINKNQKLSIKINHNPSKYLISSLIKRNIALDINNNKNDYKFNAIIRGGLGAGDFLSCLKEISQEKCLKTYRLALMEDSYQNQFFYAPVGIDEANSIDNKYNFVLLLEEFFKEIGISPKISMLSGGRAGDKGRDSLIDINIEETEILMNRLNSEHPNINISHDYILIENAIKNYSDVIFAPEGISGNLIYRTLVHLGGGKAFGAIYLNQYIKFQKLIIDTSRVAEVSEYEGSILLALHL